MCIVVSKPAGVARPTDEQFINMMRRNPDGFGMATWAPKKGLVVKKTMDEKEYLNWISQVKDDTPAIFHMRIATHGSVKKNNCHPFLSDDKTWAFAHNGILDIEAEKDKTDSETFFKRIAMPFIHNGMMPGTDEFDRMIMTIIGHSKFVFLDNNGNLHTYGNFIEKDGLMFSNTSYEKQIATSYSTLPLTCTYNYPQTYSVASNPTDNFDDCYVDEIYYGLYDFLSYNDYSFTEKELFECYKITYKQLTREQFSSIYNDVMSDLEYVFR